MTYLIRTTDKRTFEEYEIVDTDDERTAIGVFADSVRMLEKGLVMCLLYSPMYNPDRDADTIDPMDVCDILATAEYPGEYER